MAQSTVRTDTRPRPVMGVPGSARHQEFTDSDRLSAAVRHLNLELIQRSCGRFHGDLSFGALGEMMVQFIHLNQASISRAMNAPDRLAILVQLRGTHPCIWNGHAAEGSSVITYGPGYEHFGLGPKEFACALISVSSERIELLLERCHRSITEQLQTGCHQLKAPVAPFVQLEKQLTQLQGLICSKPTVFGDPGIRQLFEHSLEESLLSVISTAGQRLHRRGATDRENSGRIIRQAEQFLESHPDQPIHLIELCSVLGASPEALKHAFNEILNIDAKRYLRLYRLHRVRKTLLASSPSEISVPTVAKRWGFWNRPWFEAEYRWMFSELPSRTLARTP